MGCLCKSVTGAICDREGKVTMSCLWYLRLNHFFRVHPIRVQELVKKYWAGLVDGKMCREKTTTINAFYFWISTNNSLLKLETHRSSHKIWTSFFVQPERDVLQHGTRHQHNVTRQSGRIWTLERCCDPTWRRRLHPKWAQSTRHQTITASQSATPPCCWKLLPSGLVHLIRGEKLFYFIQETFQLQLPSVGFVFKNGPHTLTTHFQILHL